jgi:MFS superfamily sulfate permease-like transporter
MGQGLANIIGSFNNSYPVSGSFSRSALNLQAGAVTGISSVITGLAVGVTLLFFTQLLYHLPQSVLAAIIIVAVAGLLNVSGFVHAWRAKWFDGAISVITFISTLIFAPHIEKGIVLGVFLSLLVMMYKNMRPTVASLSMHTDESLRDSNIHGLKQCKYVSVIRFDGPLFFANASYLEAKLSQRRAEMKALRHIHIVANGINDLDASGEEVLSLMVDRVRKAGMDITFSGVNNMVMSVMRRTFLLEKIGEDHIFPTIEKAMQAFHSKVHEGVVEGDCPLLNVCRIK